MLSRPSVRISELAINYRCPVHIVRMIWAGKNNRILLDIPSVYGCWLLKIWCKHPIFDDYTKFDTRVDINLGYTQQMQAASRDLARAIEQGQIPISQFTDIQLKQIKSGSAQVDCLTWHHHQDSGRMQLIPKGLHDSTRHIGGQAMSGGC